MSASRNFTNGVYCPLVTPFFEGSEEINFKAWQTQVLRLANAGMGLVLLGTNGEASHLADDERSALIKSARTVLNANGFERLALLVGTGTGSAHQTIKLCVEAKAAGGDYAIVIAPGYFAFAMGKDKVALKAFFVEVMDKSPIPIMIYNFPGAASGIDLDSDFIIDLSKHQNCFGVKLTCAGIGKGQRIASHTQSTAYLARHTPFQVLPGYSDYLLPALLAKQTGCITGTGNVIPKTIVKLYNTSISALTSGDLKEMAAAAAIQDIVTEADWIIVKAGISGTKYALDSLVQKGLGGVGRKPLPETSVAIMKMVNEGMVRAMAYENSL